MTDTTTPALPDIDDMAHSAVQEALSYGVSHDVFKRHMHAVMVATEQAVREALAQQAQPAAWQVWWGIGEKRPHWPPYKTEAEALLAAAEIKSVTEVRPLYTTQPSQLELAQECKQWCGSDHCLGGCGNVTGLASHAQPAPAGDVLTDALRELVTLYERNSHATPIDEANGNDSSEREKAAWAAARAALTQEGSTK